MISKNRFRTRGMALIESMVSLAVVGLGFLAISGMQMTLKRNTDTSRIRTIATNVAQEQLERMRSFDRLTGDGNSSSWSNLASGRDFPDAAETTNLARHWVVTGETADTHRLVTVRVDWGTHAEVRQETSITLATLVSRSDPANIGGLALPPTDGAVRSVRQRHLSIPFSSRTLGGKSRGKSAMPWINGSYLIFNNADGGIVARCAFQPDDATDVASQCAAFSGNLVEGYINGVDPQSAVGVRHPNRRSASAAESECAVERLSSRVGEVANSYHYRCVVESGDERAPDIVDVSPGTVVCEYSAETSDMALEKYTRGRRRPVHFNFLLSASGACPETTQPYLGT